MYISEPLPVQAGCSLYSDKTKYIIQNTEQVIV